MPRIVEDALLIYTDGSLFPTGRKGGYGILFVHVDAVGHETIIQEHAPPGISGTTGNRMELLACVEALKLAPECECYPTVAKVVIRTDSQYITSNHTNALFVWSKARWRNGFGKPIDNADLWKDFVRAYAKVQKRIIIEKVKGHGRGKAKDPHNYTADKLARSSAKHPLSSKSYRASVRKKFAPGETKIGSVRLVGQSFVIYVIEVLRMRTQRVWKYRYQVVSPDSPDRNAIDFIFSSETLRDGHFYEVQVNDDMRHPQLVTVIREVPKVEVDSLSTEPAP